MFKVEGSGWSCVDDWEVETECEMDVCDVERVEGCDWSCADDWEVEQWRS